MFTSYRCCRRHKILPLHNLTNRFCCSVFAIVSKSHIKVAQFIEEPSPYTNISKALKKLNAQVTVHLAVQLSTIYDSLANILITDTLHGNIENPLYYSVRCILFRWPCCTNVFRNVQYRNIRVLFTKYCVLSA